MMNEQKSFLEEEEEKFKQSRKEIMSDPSKRNFDSGLTTVFHTYPQA